MRERIKANKRLYIKGVLIALCGIILSVSMVLAGGQIERDSEGRIQLRRNDKGLGERLEHLILEIGEENIEFQVSISGQGYTPDELTQMFQEGIEKLEEIMLGKNQSLEVVTSDLLFVDRLPGGQLSVEWNVGSYEYLTHLGQLKEENIPDEGVLVEIEATLFFENEFVVIQRAAHLYPKEYSPLERWLKALEQDLERLDQETRDSEYLTLPTEVESQPISWHLPPNYDYIGILVLGFVVAVMYVLSEKQKEKATTKKKQEQMLLDYPKVIETFSLFIGAGMTPRVAWFRICELYLKQREEKGIRYVYEEMVFTMYEIKGGKAEAICYEDFGSRIGITFYRKFGALLAGNVKKGAKGMVQLLRNQAEDAREERKNTAKRLGDEVGTKLMLPMFMMLGIVLIVVILPAFMSIQL